MATFWALVSGIAGVLLGWYAHAKGGNLAAEVTLGAFVIGGLATWAVYRAATGTLSLIQKRQPRKPRIDPY